jgi:hypothetical protein
MPGVVYYVNRCPLCSRGLTSDQFLLVPRSSVCILPFNLGFKYSNPSVYEQSVHEFSLIRDAQINTCFSIYEPIFYELLPLANRSLFPSGSNGKFIFVLRVFALRAVLEERIKLVNREITVQNMLLKLI